MSDDAVIRWTVELSVSYPAIDDQHKELIDYLVRLQLSIEDHDMGEARQLLDDFIRYTQGHFMEEESLMHAIGYPRLMEHELRHESLLEEIRQLKKSVDAQKIPVSLALLAYLRVWLFEHIKTADRRLGEFLNARAGSGPS